MYKERRRRGGRRGVGGYLQRGVHAHQVGAVKSEAHMRQDANRSPGVVCRVCCRCVRGSGRGPIGLGGGRHRRLSPTRRPLRRSRPAQWCSPELSQADTAAGTTSEHVHDAQCVGQAGSASLLMAVCVCSEEMACCTSDDPSLGRDEGSDGRSRPCHTMQRQRSARFHRGGDRGVRTFATCWKDVQWGWHCHGPPRTPSEQPAGKACLLSPAHTQRTPHEER